MKCFPLHYTIIELVFAPQQGQHLFSLVYEIEVVLPIEVEIPSIRVLRESKLEEEEWVQARFDQLNLIGEKNDDSFMP